MTWTELRFLLPTLQMHKYQNNYGTQNISLQRTGKLITVDSGYSSPNFLSFFGSSLQQESTAKVIQI